MASERSRGPRMRRLVTWLLRSPFAGLVDGSILLITLRGRKSGLPFTFPVEYAEDENGAWVLAGHPESKTWWRNLEPAADVRLRIRGRDVDAVGRAFTGDAASSTVKEGLVAYARRFPSIAAAGGSRATASCSTGRVSRRWPGTR